MHWGSFNPVKSYFLLFVLEMELFIENEFSLRAQHMKKTSLVLIQRNKLSSNLVQLLIFTCPKNKMKS